MDKRGINQSIIESIMRSDNTEFISNIDDKVRNILSAAVVDLSKIVSFISIKNVVLQPMNELMSGAMGDSSRYVYFLGVDDGQLELNSYRKSSFWLNFKARLKKAWANRKKKPKKKKKKKNVEPENEVLEIHFDPNKYNMYNLTQDLQNATLKYLSTTTLTYFEAKQNRLSIIGKEDFGPNTMIVIYPVIYHAPEFKYYAGARKGFISIDIEKRSVAMDEKYDQVGEILVKVLKVLNVFYNNVNGYYPNQILMESILCACPNHLFSGENEYEIFLKIINYITFMNFKNVKSIANPDKNLFEDKLININMFDFNKFMASFNELH